MERMCMIGKMRDVIENETYSSCGIWQCENMSLQAVLRCVEVENDCFALRVHFCQFC